MGIERDDGAVGRCEKQTARQHRRCEVRPVLPHSMQRYPPGAVARHLIGRHAAGSGESDPDGAALFPAYRMCEELTAWPVEQRQFTAEMAWPALSAHIVP